MRAKRFTVTASAGGPTYSPVYPIDTWNNPCNIGLGVEVTGSALYTVQHTFANPWSQNLNTVSAVWYSHATLVSGTSNADGNYAFPPRAIRLLLSSAAAATATLTIQQAGPDA